MNMLAFFFSPLAFSTIHHLPLAETQISLHQKNTVFLFCAVKQSMQMPLQLKQWIQLFPQLEKQSTRIKNGDIIILHSSLATSKNNKDRKNDSQALMRIDLNHNLKSNNTCECTDINNYFVKTIITSIISLHFICMTICTAAENLLTILLISIMNSQLETQMYLHKNMKSLVNP